MTTAENDVMMFLLGYNLKMFVYWKKKDKMEIQKFDYLKNEKSFLDEIKKHIS